MRHALALLALLAVPAPAQDVGAPLLGAFRGAAALARRVADKRPKRDDGRSLPAYEGPPRQVVLPPAWPAELSVTPITTAEATALFDAFKRRDDLMWDYARDGCYARAHLMAWELEQRQGIIADKVFAYPNNGGKLYVNLPGYPPTPWNFHVAPLVFVLDGGVYVPLVIDPLLADKPLPLADWQKKVDIFQKGTVTYAVQSRFVYKIDGKHNGASSWDPKILEEARDALIQLKTYGGVGPF